MIESETHSTDVLPDEDRLAFPESWGRFVQPRRGRSRPRKLKLDPEGGERFRAREEASVRACLASEANAAYADAALAFLGGAADVAGAGAVMALARPLNHSASPVRRSVFDMAAAAHGLPFAVAALAESFTLHVERTGADDVLSFTPLADHRWGRLSGDTGLRAVRAHLASLGDAEYAAVVAALAEHRADPEHRLAASLLVPDERQWLDEVCAEHHRHHPHAQTTPILFEVVADGEQLDAVDPSTAFLFSVQVAEIADLLHRLGAAALPAVEGYFRCYNDSADKKTLYRAIAAMPSDAAFDRLLDDLGESIAVGFAMEAAARFPQRALRLIAARLPGAEPAVRQRLTALLHADPLILGPALALQDDAVREAVAAVTAGADRLPAAPAAALPDLLAAPPWEAAAPAPVVLKGLTPPAINRVVWAEGEHEAWAEAEPNLHRFYGDQDWAEAAKGFADADPHRRLDILAMAPPGLTAEYLPEWRPGPGYVNETVLKRIVVNHGAAAAEQVAVIAGSDPSLREVLLPVANLAAARLAADALARLKTLRPYALAWLDRHGPDAAALLVPDALGKAKKPRAAAEAALRYIAANRGADTVREAAARYGAEVAEAVAPLLHVDPLAPVGVPLPKLGPWVSPPALPQVLLPGRERALPDPAVRNVATVLALGSPDYDYPGVAVLAETCDRLSLARFSRALFEQWLTAGAPWDDSWALTQLMHFGDDEVVHVLAPLIGRWPGENQHHRAVKGLQTLGAIGSEAALRAIQGIGEKAKFAAIKEEARAQITAIAARLGLTAEQLADRLVPDFGLREESALVLDYGPRRFKVGFDEQLKPFVTDADGKPRKSLPKPSAKDDPLLADASYKRFANLRKELRTVAADQVKRLERAMVTGRSWTRAEFDEHFAGHPLTWHLARRLVWTADDGSGPVAFRLAEDRTRTDADEEELAVAETAVIRLAHPALLGDQVAAWAEILADYEIVQPFEQIGRPVAAFTEAELATGHLARFEGAGVTVGSLLGLVKKGWVRSGPLDAGIEHGMWCELPGTGYLVLDLDPGIYAGDVNDQWHQTLRQVVVSKTDMAGWTRAQAAPGLAPGDPVAVSEALTALAKVVEAGS